MEKREHWGSKLGFILAASGSAVGLGNIWKYPYIAGENGGGAFTLIYLFCILIVGMPIVIGEFVIGRKTQLSPVGAFEKLAPNSYWKWVGMLGVCSAFVILAFGYMSPSRVRSWRAALATWALPRSTVSCSITGNSVANSISLSKA